MIIGGTKIEGLYSTYKNLCFVIVMCQKINFHLRLQ